jgi:hypothetical protein
MDIQDALRPTGKANMEGWDTDRYVEIKEGQFINTDGHKFANACILSADWQPYHEVKEIRPERAGELWKHERGLHGHTFKHPSGDIYFNDDNETTLATKAKAVIHNKNGWTRLFPLPEDDSIERIEIKPGIINEIKGFSVYSFILSEEYRDSINGKKMILEIPKGDK